MVRQTTAPTWAQIAVEWGYFDQSHLIRDFLAFAGLSPTDSLRRQSVHLKRNHRPLAK